MPRFFAYALPFVVVALAPAPSLAASNECPDGWFCEPNAAPPASAPPSPATRPGRAPGNGYPGNGYPGNGYPGNGYPGNGYPGNGGYPALQGSAEQSQLAPEVPPENPSPKRRRRRGFREWGFNLHLEGALLGNEAERDSHVGMGGLGFGFRYRLMPPLAFEAGIDLLKGTDERGYARNEAALLLNTLVFFNPYDVVQVYALAGLGFSRANVTIAPRSGDELFKRYDEHYSYFGGQLGLGVEVRVSRRVAVAGDLIGFVRGRTDNHWRDSPDFIAANGQRDSNTSGGGLLRAGVTFYW